LNAAKIKQLHSNKVDYRLNKVGNGLINSKRESRRLVGDYIYTFNDVRNTPQFEDAVVFEKREVDVH